MMQDNSKQCKATQTIDNSDKRDNVGFTDIVDNSDFNEGSLVYLAMFSQTNLVQSLSFTLW